MKPKRRDKMNATNVELEVTAKPSTKQKVAVVVADAVVTLAVTTLAGMLTNTLTEKVNSLIIPDQKS
jgi:hypothetical protein